MNVYSLEDAKKAYLRGDKMKFLFFWGHTPAADGHVTGSGASAWVSKIRMGYVPLNGGEPIFWPMIRERLPGRL